MTRATLRYLHTQSMAVSLWLIRRPAMRPGGGKLARSICHRGKRK